MCAGWESREKDGLPRLIEALEMNMWSSMQRRGRYTLIFALLLNVILNDV